MIFKVKKVLTRKIGDLWKTGCLTKSRGVQFDNNIRYI